MVTEFPSDTLAHYGTLPQFRPINISQVPLKSVIKALRSYSNNLTGTELLKVGGDKLVDAGQEAMRFYGCNAAAAQVRERFHPYQPLPSWAHDVMNTYTQWTYEQLQRFFYYMILIGSRESRHNKSPYTFGNKVIANFLNSTTGCDADDRVQSLFTDTPNVTLGEYVNALWQAFNTAPFGGSYGGKKWAGVMKPLCQFVAGEISGEALLDTGYSLQHNTNAIFNKGMFYGMSKSNLRTILDVQRAGYMLEYLTHEVSGMDVKLEGITVREYVDWFEVDKWAVKQGLYEAHKKKQVAAGHDPLMGDWKVDGDLPIFPGVTVKKITRKEKVIHHDDDYLQSA